MKRTALPFLLGCLFIFLMSMNSIKKPEPIITKPAFPTSYHIKIFKGYHLQNQIKNHIISFYRKGYVIKSNSVTSDHDLYSSGIVVMEKY